MGYWLGLDCGGTFIKAGIYDERGREQGIARRNLDVISRHPGWLERDMDQLWQKAATVIREALSASRLPASVIAGVGVSAQGKGAYLLDKQCKPLRDGILSSDQRALELVRGWQAEGVPAQLYKDTLQTLWTGHPASLLRWLKDNERDNYDRIGAVLMAHDYLRFRLAGVVGCEVTNISESNLYNMHTGAYDPALAEKLGIGEVIEKMPPIVGSSEIVGGVSAEAAEATGLAAGTPVVGGLFDVVSTALCAGIDDETRVNAVMGTWSVTTGVVSAIRRFDDYPFVHGRHAEPGYFIIHEASPTSAVNLEWIAQRFGGTENKLDYGLINREVGALPKAASSVFFLPFVFGTNAGLGMKGGFYGMQALHERGHLLQAVYEGVVFSHYTHLKRILRCFPETGALRITGGPAHSDVWMQIFADCAGLPVELPQVEETGCLGAALAAAVGTGTFSDFFTAIKAVRPEMRTIEPDLKAHELYQEKFGRYLELIDCLRAFEKIA